MRDGAVNEIYKMGAKLNENSYSILDFLISNSIQLDAVRHYTDDHNKKKAYGQLKESRERITKLSGKIEAISDEDYLSFLKGMKNIGELAAIELLATNRQ